MALWLCIADVVDDDDPDLHDIIEADHADGAARLFASESGLREPTVVTVYCLDPEHAYHMRVWCKETYFLESVEP